MKEKVKGWKQKLHRPPFKGLLMRKKERKWGKLFLPCGKELIFSFGKEGNHI